MLFFISDQDYSLGIDKRSCLLIFDFNQSEFGNKGGLTTQILEKTNTLLISSHIV